MPRALADDVSVHEFPFSMLAIPLGGRSTLLRSPSGEVVVVSPGPPDSAFDAEMVRNSGLTLVAPNAFHHLHVGATKNRHSDARVIAAAGAAKKMKGPVDGPLTENALPAGFVVVPMEGAPEVDESWIFHEPSGTLVVTDLAFNLHDVKGTFARWFFRWNQSLDRFGPTKHGLSQVKDKRALRRSVDRVLELPLTRIVVSHGDVVEQDAREVLREGFANVG